MILLVAFFMLQAHNLMPHKHEVPKTSTHGHDGSDHHHHDQPANPTDNTDHNAEFGNALVKPVNTKYELTPLKITPYPAPASLPEISDLYSFIPQLSSALPGYLLPPDPNLQGIALRGPPSSI
ncbi:MAG: hypothetical protein WBJ10_06115 [Daejeonella sp.]|uniref:hypothetical protein n=1 Tax=Daejeonella sp. TaxID=2805397 RepID=UPI003C78BD09